MAKRNQFILLPIPVSWSSYKVEEKATGSPSRKLAVDSYTKAPPAGAVVDSDANLCFARHGQGVQTIIPAKHRGAAQGYIMSGLWPAARRASDT